MDLQFKAIALAILSAYTSVACAFNVQYNTKLAGNALRHLWDVPIRRCNDECLARTKCKSFNYVERLGFCELNAFDSSEHELDQAPGYTYVAKTSVDKTSRYSACQSKCTSAEVCELEKGQPICVVKECSEPPEITSTTIQGNMRHIGSRVLYMCDVAFVVDPALTPPVTSSSKCLEDGKWSPVNITCKLPATATTPEPTTTTAEPKTTTTTTAMPTTPMTTTPDSTTTATTTAALTTTTIPPPTTTVSELTTTTTAIPTTPITTTPEPTTTAALTTTTTTPEPTTTAETPKFSSGTIMGNVTFKNLDEASGLAASQRHPGILYSHNDHGGNPEIFAISTEGKLQAVFNIHGVTSDDWEDIAVGKCTNGSSEYCIYVTSVPSGNANNNYVFRFREPDELTNQSITVNTSQILHITWSGSDTNYETLMVDPEANVYIISKVNSPDATLTRLPNSEDDSSEPIIVHLSVLHDPVAGDISPDGNEILIKTDEEMYYWSMRDLESHDYMTVLQTPGVKVPYTKESKGRSVCWDYNGNGYYTTSEGEYQPIYYYEKN